MELVLIGMAVVTAIICAMTGRVVHRDGYRPQPARTDFDSRRPAL